jgi:hypothetical protein
VQLFKIDREYDPNTAVYRDVRLDNIVFGSEILQYNPAGLCNLDFLDMVLVTRKDYVLFMVSSYFCSMTPVHCF